MSHSSVYNSIYNLKPINKQAVSGLTGDSWADKQGKKEKKSKEEGKDDESLEPVAQHSGKTIRIPEIGPIKKLFLRTRLGVDGEPVSYVICIGDKQPLRYCAAFSMRAEFAPFLEEFTTLKWASSALVLLARKLGVKAAESAAKNVTDRDIAFYFPEESRE